MSSVSQSRSFLLITAVVSILLLVALIAVVALTFRTEYAAIPTATPRPTDSPSPTNAETPSEAIVQDSSADRSRLDSAGFAYRAPSGYAESPADNSVTFTGVGDDGGMAPTFLLSGGPRTQFVDQEHESLDDAFVHFVDFFAERDNFDVSDVEPFIVDGMDARSVQLISQDNDASFAGRIVMAQPDDDRLFVMTGVAPQQSWEQTASDRFMEVLESVIFFAPEPSAPLLVPTQTPTATPLPSATPTPIPLSMPLPTPSLEDRSADLPSLYSNANFIRELAPAGNTLWAASDGGIMAWNQRSGGQIKFTALDGLAGNHFRTASNCPLPGMGVVFGNELGLQIFDARSGTWNALNDENSAMHFNDVSVVRCYPAFDFAVVGYEQNGLDVYDATTNEWQSIGPADGLLAATVEDIAVIGNRDAIWVSSGTSLTALSNGQPAVYSENNSPLTGSLIGAMKVIDGDTLWIGEPGTVHRIQDGQWLAYSANASTGRFPTGIIVLPQRPICY